MTLGTTLLIGSSYKDDVETIARSILYCRSDAGGKDDKAAVVASSMAVVREVGLVE
jgi:hypothetical protein